MKSLLKDVSYDELMQMRESGMTNYDIANALGVSTQTVYRHMADPAKAETGHER